jgi:hypothetical protein
MALGRRSCQTHTRASITVDIEGPLALWLLHVGDILSISAGFLPLILDICRDTESVPHLSLFPAAFCLTPPPPPPPPPPKTKTPLGLLDPDHTISGLSLQALFRGLF